MNRWLSRLAMLAAILAAQPPAPSQGPRLVANYPLAGDLNDATGQNSPLRANNAPFVSGKGIFCNGLYSRERADACDVATPVLRALDLSSFTISARFLVPRSWLPA